MTFLHMSISGAIMILLIAVLRAFLIDKLPKKTFFIMWITALLRLLVPFSYRYTVSANMVSTPTETVPAEVITNAVQLTGDAVQAPKVPIWLIIWLVGAALMTLYFVISYTKHSRYFMSSSPVQTEFISSWLQDHRLKRRIEICTGNVSSPMTCGVFRPIILLPKHNMDENTLKYVLKHEYIHIKRFDNLTKLIMTAALCLHWFNPFVWMMYVLMNRDIELLCDEAVIRSYGEDSRSSYAKLLINMEETKSGLIYSSFSRSASEERIKSIMKTRKITKTSVIISAVIIVCVIAVFAVSSAVKRSTVFDQDLIGYSNMSYGQFVRTVGSDADHYHANFFAGKIPDSNVNIVFVASKYDEEKATMVLSNSDKPTRLEGNLGELIPNMENTMTIDEFANYISADEHAVITATAVANTAYYIAPKYAMYHVEDKILHVSLAKSNFISADSYAWLINK